MSEEGWHGFLAAEGLDDWVVLHGGATAVFRVGSLGEAARLAEAVAKAPGIAGAGAPVPTDLSPCVEVALTESRKRQPENYCNG